MTVSRIGIAYAPVTGGSYNILLENFIDNLLPRSYVGQTSYDLSQTGASILAGPAFREKYMWTISSYVTAQQALDFDEMFRAWDTDRANGYAAAVGVTDETFGPTVTTSAVFMTPPATSRLSAQTYLIAFGIQEV